MIHSDLDDDDLRYLQEGDFISGPLGPWIRSKNLFEQRLANNLRPGQSLFLDQEALVRVLGSAALARPSMILTVELTLQGALAQIAVISSSRGMPSVCADDAGSLLPALRWYSARGEQTLRLAVCAPGLFWFPAIRSGGTHESL